MFIFLFMDLYQGFFRDGKNMQLKMQWESDKTKAYNELHTKSDKPGAMSRLQTSNHHFLLLIHQQLASYALSQICSWLISWLVRD